MSMTADDLTPLTRRVLDESRALIARGERPTGARLHVACRDSQPHVLRQTLAALVEAGLLVIPPALLQRSPAAMTADAPPGRRVRPRTIRHDGPCAAQVRAYRAAWRRIRALLAPATVPAPPIPTAPVPEPSASVVITQGMDGRYLARVYVGPRPYLAGRHATRAQAEAAAQARLEAIRSGSPGLRQGSSRYRGVSVTPYGTFVARLRIGGRYVLDRTFAVEEDAARAWDEAAGRHLGAQARLNFPGEDS